jgi:hypothetical protein
VPTSRGHRGVDFGTFATSRLERGPVPTVRTGSGEEATRAHASPAASPLRLGGGRQFVRSVAHNPVMDGRVGLAVYFLIAAAAAFVTASRNLPLPLLLGLLAALAVAAILVRSQVIKVHGTTRVALGFIVTYVVTYFAVVALFVR